MSIPSPGPSLQLADSKVSTPFSSGSVRSSFPLIDREKPVAQSESHSCVTEQASTSPVSLRERLRHFTWAWYTLIMSTGGTALLLAFQPHRFPGLHRIAIAVFSLNIAFFVLISCIMAARFIIHGGLMQSLKHPKEGLFFPTVLLSIATIITGLERCFDSEDAPHSLTITLEVLFWLYSAASFTLAVAQYSYIFSSVTYRLQTAMTSWVLPCFPIMLAGTVASTVARFQPDRSTIPIVIAGVTFNGLGIMITFMVYTLFFGRLMEFGLPDREARPAMFICVGPPSFGALAFLGMVHDLRNSLNVMSSSNTFLDQRSVEMLALMTASFLWALSFWFFCITIVAIARAPPTGFKLLWWAMLFPNTGFSLATIALGEALESTGVQWVGSAMTVCDISMWLFVFTRLTIAVARREIVYPGKDEDTL